ncbi:serum amyloid P-component [Rhynchocyon petersi]
MDQLLVLISILITLTEAFAQTDLSGKVFVFPRESYVDHVSLIPNLEKPLQNLTLCFRVYSDLSRGYTLFSYNTKGTDNELLVYKNGVGEYSLYIGGTGVIFKDHDEGPAPVHICATWESSSGIAELWVNAKPLVRKGLKQGYSVETQPKIVLGQEQDNYGGGFDQKQCFTGEIGELYMWDYVLSTSDIESLYQGLTFSSTILNWKALNYEMKGYVVIKPQLWK